MQWTTPASPALAQPSQLSEFTAAFAEFSGRKFSNWAEVHAWSVREFREFWRFFLLWCGKPLGLVGEAEPVCVGDVCETARFFPNLQLNYADSLLNPGCGPSQARALTEVHADGTRRSWTRAELRNEVARLAASLEATGLRPGDRVVAVVRNDARAVITALAVAAVGGTLSTVSPDLGVQAMLDRFGALSPRLLIAHVAARPFDSGVPLPEKIAALVRALSSLRFVLRLDEAPLPCAGALYAVSYETLLRASDVSRFVWRKFRFDHPLFVMFSSGTTGRPKCIVHGAGGTLLEHVKEHRLHTDLRSGDRMYFHTSCAWMMWNWQLSALASGVHIVTYDGPISSADCLWRLAAEERVTVFGTSPGYLRMSQDAQLAPGRQFELSALRAVLSTGAVLHDEQFRWVREQVRAVPVQSISGGTDIIGCFVLGNPDLPVNEGEAQCKSLGLDVQAWKNGAPTEGIGELVCTNPFPSRPLGFLGDDDGSRFHAAYFARNPAVWTHGDLIEFSPQGGARLHGRTDGVLNVRGIKFAPMEIYRALNGIEEVREAMVVEQRARTNGDQAALPEQRIVALLVLRDGAALSAALAARVREQIATHLSPAHVPDDLIAVPELPITYSGKPSEAAARAAVNGEPIANVDALRNPACLEAIRGQVALARGAGCSAPPPSAQQPLTMQLRRLFQRHLGLAEVSLEASFFDLGGRSLAAVRLLADVQRLTGRALPLGALMHAPSIKQLLEVIEGRASAPPSSVLVPMRRGSGNPLFVVHSQSGTVVEMWPIVGAMRSERPVWGLQAPGIDGEQATPACVEDLAARYVEQVRTVQPRGPYALCGFSFGGTVAFEMARRLAHAGETLELVCLLDPYLYHALSWSTAGRQIWVRGSMRLARLRLRDMPAFALHYLGRMASEAAIRLGLRPRPRPSQGLQLSATRARVYDALATALEAYRPQTYEAGPVAFIRASNLQEGYFDPMPVWRRVALGGLDVIDVPGSHLDVIRPNAELVALHIDTLLAWSSSKAAQFTNPARATGPLTA